MSAPWPFPMKYVLALGQGTTSSRAIVFGEGGRPVGVAQKGFAKSFRRPGGWNTTPGRSGVPRSPSLGRPSPKRARLRGRHRRHRDRQPTRDSGDLGPRERPALHPRSSGRTAARRARCDGLHAQGLERTFREKDGPAPRPVLQRHQAGVAARRRPRRPREGPSAEIAFGTIDSWLMYNLTGERSTSRTPLTPRAPCSITSTPASGTTNCCGF